MDRLTPAVFFKAQPLTSGEFTGIASAFGNVDSYGDTVAPGAFAKSLNEHRARGTMPALLWAHDPSEPIGRWVKLAEDRQGLQADGRLTLGTKRGQEAHALMKDGALGLSIGYRTKASSLKTGGGRLLTEIDLVEISAVALPANHAARITGVKSRPMNIRDYEAELREALGFSTREARALASRGWPALSQRDAENGEQELLAAIKAATTTFKGK